MFSGTFESLSLGQRNFMEGSKRFRTAFPHQKATVIAAMPLIKKRLMAVLLNARWHMEIPRKIEKSQKAIAVYRGYQPNHSDWPYMRSLRLRTGRILL